VNRKLPVPQPDRASYLKHKRETTRHILLPVILSGVLILALFTLVAYATFAENGDVERWAAISTVWIVIPLMALLLAVMVVLWAAVYGLHRLLNITPEYTGIAQEIILRVNAKTRWYAAEVTNRVIRFRAWVDTLQAFFKRD
jgi:ABC-type transport system involved in multi-copper enzyme maturation permease subunit